jgi:pimeloyl-ACP methyl ester carboxylesterase
VANYTRTELSVDGVRTSMLVAGPQTGDTAVVFVHGSSGSSSDWEPLLDPVGRFARSLAPDMPGYGESDKPATFDYTTAGYARYLAQLLATAGIRRVHLVGHDLGGPWGLAWAAEHPTQLASLTLIGIGVLPGYRWHRYARLYRIPVVGELVLRTANRRAVAQVLGRGSRQKPSAAFIDRVLSQYRDRGTRHAVLSFYRRTPDLGAETVRAAAALTEANPATLIIWGGGDPYVPVRFAALQRRFVRRAEVVVLPGSGHWPLEDSPKAVTDRVTDFLRREIGDEPVPLG